MKYLTSFLFWCILLGCVSCHAPMQPCGVVSNINTHAFDMVFTHTNGTLTSFRFNSDRLDTIKIGTTYCLQTVKR